MQYYKAGDVEEKKFADSFDEVLDLISDEEDAFFSDAFIAYSLGDVLFDLKRDPMSGVLTKEIYRISFPAIHELFTRAGTFEFYLSVFRSIWGPDVVVVFSVPSPGVLNINISGLTVVQDNFTARAIVSEAYVYDLVIRETAGDFIMFQSMTGVKTQREVDALINEISPAGIFVTALLAI